MNNGSLGKGQSFRAGTCVLFPGPESLTKDRVLRNDVISRGRAPWLMTQVLGIDHGSPVFHVNLQFCSFCVCFSALILCGGSLLSFFVCFTGGCS